MRCSLPEVLTPVVRLQPSTKTESTMCERDERSFMSVPATVRLSCVCVCVSIRKMNTHEYFCRCA
jgi:hypothetical protein